MILKQIILIIQVSFILFVVGCAQSKLRVQTDLYAEDPRVESILTPVKTGKMLASLDRLKLSAMQRNRDLIELAKVEQDLYILSYNAASFNDTDLEHIKKRYQSYKEAVNNSYIPLEKVIDSASEALNDYDIGYEKAVKKYFS